MIFTGKFNERFEVILNTSGYVCARDTAVKEDEQYLLNYSFDPHDITVSELCGLFHPYLVSLDSIYKARADKEK